MFLFSQLPPKYLVLTQARMECVTGALSSEVKWPARETHNSPTSSGVDKISGASPPLVA
jgi:hypothetical protein